MAKNTYIVIVKKIPCNIGETKAQVNVSNLNKKEIEKRIDELEIIFPKDEYGAFIVESNNDMREFQNNPN